MTGRYRTLLEQAEQFLAEHYRGPGVDELRAEITRTLNATLTECPHCGHHPRLADMAAAHPDTLRALLTAVERGGIPVEAAARLIETWPAPKGDPS
ncbi:hypothetical protein [Pseudonocardia parietis]|uniref:Uncharacterized protein n=1 Tax=Pseudonocardia parietis TaxID=570936 RepID=A0ABS4W274_9PSEU|nr:hypothetical protein [Pseudonocardia parietis]MBP2370281.1 hypothetical protein [Pseudonocardia parietis]